MSLSVLIHSLILEEVSKLTVKRYFLLGYLFLILFGV